MSTAQNVPETVGIPGPGPLTLLRGGGRRRLLSDSMARLRFADGFSHSRAMAFQVVLTIVPASIAIVALASALEWESLSGSVLRIMENVSPGATSDVFREAFEQGLGRTGSAATALLAGTIAALIAGTTAFGQLERTANRIYGTETDRPTRQKYRLAALMCLATSAVVLLGLIGVGELDDWRRRNDGDWGTLTRIASWPVGGIFILIAFVAIFSICPRRRQPGPRWVAVGAAVSMLCFAVVTVALGLYLDASGSFGDTYGPLAGLMGVLLWSYGISVSVFIGVAVSAQLEAVRAGVAGPRDEVKVELGEPDASVVSYGAALSYVEPAQEARQAQPTLMEAER